MPWQFGGYPVCDKWEAASGLLDTGTPYPPEFLKANTVLLPVGPQYGRGWILMVRSDVEKLGENLCDLRVTDSKGDNPLVSSGWLPVASRKLFQGKNNDPNSLHLVEIVDGRWRADNPNYMQGIARTYNVVAPDTGQQVYVDPVAGDVAWTWDTMVADIWSLLTSHLGPYPGLGFVPNNNPYNWSFLGVSAYAALTEVLDILDCVLAPNLDGTFRIAQLGLADAATDKALKKAVALKTNDGEFLFGTHGRMPGVLRTYFHVQYGNYGEENTTTRSTAAAAGGQWQMAPAYLVDTANPYGGDPAIAHCVWDDMPAVFSSTTGTIQGASGTLCAARAAARAARFFRSLNGCPKLSQAYSGAVRVLPGSTIKGVAWRQDQEGGTITSIVGGPNRRIVITDDGEWRTLRNESSSTATRPPDFRKRWPIYPSLDQVLFVNKLDSGDPCVKANADGYFNCSIAQFDSASFTWIEREPVWGVILNENDPYIPATCMSSNHYQRASGRLTGAALSGGDYRPVYAFMVCWGDSP